MKIVRKTPIDHQPLWLWLKDKVPRSIRAKKYTDGYGWMYGFITNDLMGICTSGTILTSGWVAKVENYTLELLQPQYYGDFEPLLRRYEKETKNKVKFIFWESD